MKILLVRKRVKLIISYVQFVGFVRKLHYQIIYADMVYSEKKTKKKKDFAMFSSCNL